MNPHAFIFIGRSGCGKGTQAELVRPIIEGNTKLPVFYVETGDLFRKFIQGENYSQSLSREIYEKDARQPDFLACFMWSTLMVDKLDGGTNVVLDGTPRSLLEAKLLDTAFDFYSFEKKDVHIFYLNVSREWSQKHLLARGRSDDATLSKINSRLNWFETDVLPAIEYFKNSGHHFVEVNGEQPIENVHQDIVSNLSFQS